MGKIMREVGYSKKTAINPKDLTESKGWQELLNEVPDEELKNRLLEIAQDKDKRSALIAIDMLLKLKDKYPATKAKIAAFILTKCIR